MKLRLFSLIMLSGAFSTHASAEDISQKMEKADQLVTLTKQFELEAQAISFMLTNPPIKMPSGMKDCVTHESEPAMRSYFATQFSEAMSLDELQQSIKFFQSPDGQAVADLRLKHEKNLFTSALSGAQVSDENPHYPAQVQKALNAFGATPAGRFFLPNEILAREEVRTHVSELRSEAIGKCLSTLK